ncbi:MAG: O-antigen ligase family protein [Bacteroidales bacterium]|jgi:O-antigen ligase|nr:O-antigen ligase family protein [Bacteroidales bacterium]MDI9575172.1 O-antigen ligase family protein [Bacteroidota bacterium]MDD2593100.1 O-antigen ligase family protein [Bacteroidales bacterium]MDD3755712.1 O-antigen ligase family protein [Bacteroidales bacterium]MDY0400837.1 O-antigen ligase family protein [Bacteroidales bacterium]
MVKINTKKFFDQISPKSYYDIAIILPLLMLFIYPSRPAIGVAGFILFTIFGIIKKDLTFQWNANILWVIFFLLYVIFFFKTTNKQAGLFELEKKLSLLVFGSLFLFKYNKPISIPFWIISFIILIFIRGIINFIEAFVMYRDIHLFQAFLTTRFSQHIHPTYFSIYIIVSLFGLIYLQHKRFIKLPKWLIICYIIFSILLIIFLSSTAAILFFLFSIVFFLIFYFYKKLKPLIATIFIITILLISFITIKYIPFKTINLKETIENTILFLNNPKECTQSKEFIESSNEKRLILWKLSWEKFKENPLGYGVGSAGDVYRDVYQKYELDSFIEPLLDSHNQYLRIALEMGIIGLLAYLSILITFIVKAIKQKKYLLLFVLISLIYFGLFESVLQRQSGVIFFVYIITFLYLYEPNLLDYNKET